jgi:hypothetical protein
MLNLISHQAKCKFKPQRDNHCTPTGMTRMKKTILDAEIKRLTTEHVKKMWSSRNVNGTITEKTRNFFGLSIYLNLDL